MHKCNHISIYTHAHTKINLILYFQICIEIKIVLFEANKFVNKYNFELWKSSVGWGIPADKGDSVNFVQHSPKWIELR